MKKILLFVFVILHFSGNAFSQEKSVKEEGWELPDVSTFELKSEINKEVDGFWVKVSEFDLEKVDKKPAIFLRSKKDTENKSEMFCEVRKAKSFSIKDKIFLHSFQCVLFSIDEQTMSGKGIFRSKNYYGAMVEFYYFDEDGDGKFETRYSISGMEIKLPNWAKIQN